ncbi:MAG: hypothetical protein KIS63_00480 [Caldilineales bacterium]|nr:hypothetical protein [Caldilineales bacterium]
MSLLDAQEEANIKGNKTYKAFFDANIADRIIDTHGKLDFVVFTNVFAHIENLPEVIYSLRALTDTNTIIVIENHYLGAVLDRNQFDTFYHEHPRTYSYTSFVRIARLLGLCILSVEFPKRYGGNIRVFMGNKTNGLYNSQAHDLLDMERNISKKFDILAQRVDQWKLNKSKVIDQLVVKHGRLRAKAFPGRAAILIKLLGLTGNTISAVYEKPGSLKIGFYVPGTRIPILSDDFLFQAPSDSQPLLNLAWHIPGEIRRYLSEKGYRGPVIDIVDANDFGAK